MKSKIIIFFACLLITSLACQSSATPVAIPLEDQVLTAAAGIAFTQTAIAPLQAEPQPTQTEQPVISLTDTPVPPAPVPQETIGKVGETIIQGGYIVTLANVETAQQYGDFSQAQPGNKFISAELLIESAAATGVNVNPFYVSIKDANGYVYSMTVFGKDPALQSQNDMPIGEKNRGWVTFEVPESATGLTLIYEPISFTDTVRIRFDLGQ